MQKRGKSRKVVLGLAVIVVVALVVLVAGGYLLMKQPSQQPMGRGDFTLPIVDRTGLTGKSMTLSDLRGRVIVLEFTEPWCPYGVQFASTLERLYRQYASRGVVFIAVAGSASNQSRTIAIPVGDVADFIRNYNSSLTYVFDLNNKIFDLYSVKETPTLFILSKNGTVFMAITGTTTYDVIARGLDQAMTGAMSYTNQVSVTTQGRVWNFIPDGSLDLVDENGKIVGDLGQPYVDLANVTYSIYNGSLLFRFSLYGAIPSSIADARVASIWYQVLLDVDSNPSTGYHWSSDFTPDYMLQLRITFDNASKTVEAGSSLLKYSGTGIDWSWASTAYTPLLAGGVGQDSITLTCRYQDISVSKGSAVLFFTRSGILYDGKVHSDRVPDEGTIGIAL